MKALKFVVRYPDGRSDEFAIDADRVLIGSGAHCEIRLPVDQAAMEHVAISMAGAAPLAEARAFQPPPTLNGSPFQRAPLLPDAVIGVGQVAITVSVQDVQEGSVLQRKQEKTSPLTYILAAVAIPISLYVILADTGASQTAPQPEKFPALWAAPVTNCPQTSREQALAMAQEKYMLAEGRRERRPFHVQDGVQAVPLFETAAACYQTAGNPKMSLKASTAAKKLRKEIASDYRTHRVRLDHAISVKDWKTVQHEVGVLLNMTEGKQDPYVTWLSNIDRRLQLKYGHHD